MSEHVMTVSGIEFTVEGLSESDDHLRWAIKQHTPPEGKDFCPECDLRAPCDIVSLAASGLERSKALDAERAARSAAERERDAAQLEAAELRAAMETFADLAQLVFDRITNGVTSDERYLMKDTARIAMERYRALAGRGAGEGRGR